MQSDWAYTHFQVSWWREKGKLEFFRAPKRKPQKVKTCLSLVKGGTPCCMFFFAVSTQPLPQLCARALMHFSLPCIADNVTLEVLFKCCLAGCVVKFPPRRALPKVMGLWLVLGVDPTLWYFLTFPLALHPYLYTCFMLCMEMPRWRHVLLDVCYAMCHDATHHATMLCHAC